MILLCQATALAQPKFSAPMIGAARDTGQQLRRVDGVTGNFVLGPTIGTGAVDWAFGFGGGLVKTDTELLLIGASGTVTRAIHSPSGTAILGAAGVFFPAVSELWTIGATGNRQVSVDAPALAGTVIALGPGSGGTAELAVCREKQLWLLSIDENTGAITHELSFGGAVGKLACLSPAAGSLVVLRDRLLLAGSKELLVETFAGIERRIPIPAGRTTPELHQAGAQWVEVESAAPPFLLHIAEDGEALYQLPAAKESK